MLATTQSWSKSPTKKVGATLSWHTGTLSIRSDTQNPRNNWTINIFIHFLTTESHVSWGFPTNILLWGPGYLRPSHPRPPSPPGAAGQRNRGLRRLRSAAVCGLGSRGPRPSRRQNRTERRGENSEKIWGTSKVEVLEIVATQLGELKEHDMSWEHRIGWKSCCLWRSIEAVSAIFARCAWINPN